jgi:hypothetical protein
MRFCRTAALAAVLIAVAALLGACGDEGSKEELSNERAASLRSTLDAVEQRMESRDCSGASQQAAALRSEVQGLPNRVDADLRRALASSADRLESLVAAQCEPEVQTAPEPQVGTTSEEGAQPPEGDEDQGNKPKKDKKPKQEKPKQDEQPPPETGGSGEEDPNLDEQGGGTVPPAPE